MSREDIIKHSISVNKRASQIGRSTTATAAKLRELTELAKSRSPFGDPTDKIERLTEVITIEINNIKKEIEELERFIGRSKGNKQSSDHSATLIRTLNSNLLHTTKELNDALELRTQNLKAQQDRNYFRLSAAEGNADAQIIMGDYYHYGEFTWYSWSLPRRNLDESFSYYLLAAQQGHPIGLFYMGHGFQQGGNINRNEARIYFEEVANRENAEARINVLNDGGNELGRSKDLKESFKDYLRYFQLAADKGNPTAQYDLGNCYFRGLGMERNLKEAVGYYLKAAHQRHTSSMVRLKELLETHPILL